MADEKAPSVIEQAPVLAPPSNEARDEYYDGDVVDLDADDGDSLATEKEPKADKPETETAQDSEDDGDSDEAEKEDGEEDDGEPIEEPKPKKPSGSAKLKAQLAERQAEMAAMQAEIEVLRRAAPVADRAASLAAAVEQEIGPAPKESDYADYLAYDRALRQYDTRAIIAESEIKKAALANAQASKVRETAVIERFKERAETAREAIKDFDAVTKAATVSPSNPETVMLILQSDQGPELAYYLAKNPDKVHSLNGMSPLAAAREIGKLEASLSRVTPKKETKAPALVPKLSGGAAKQADPEKMSDAEFDRWFAAKAKGRS